jgi:hypothetical protein
MCIPGPSKARKVVVGCRHCGRTPVNRPRGLCWTCYYTPAVRERYPSESKFGRRGIDDFCGKGLMPPAPTRAMPGTPEKVAILEERARLRQALWHPQDAHFESDMDGHLALMNPIGRAKRRSA